MTMEEEGGGKVKLGLGIGVDCYGDDHNGTEEVVGKKKKYGGGGLTATQLHELEQQALIYKHFAANLPVPFHLVLPVWKSVAASFGSSNAAAINRQYPSWFSATGFDYRDHEPGRCRRTDGKKWRCNKNVVPDQKYCQQHMHRGRQRSRKPVENSEVASPSSTKTPKNSEGELENSKRNLQISTPKGLQLMAQSYNYVSVSQGTTMASSGYHECKKNIRPVTTTSIANIPANRSASTNPAAVAATTIAGPTTATNSSTNENSLNIGVKYNSSNHAGGNCMIRGSSMNVVNVSPGLGFSPKSVLQALLGCNGLYFDNGSGVELEPGRCRRTDGKKWRCRRDVLPHQKYCGQHIHRGAKRQMKDFQPVAVPSSSAAAMNTARLSQTIAICRKTNCAIPNTNLSISIPANPPLGRNDERSNSSSDSDTTLTDTSLTACDSSYVSS